MRKRRPATISSFSKFLLGYVLVILAITLSFFPILGATIRGVESEARNNAKRMLNDKAAIVDAQLAYLQNVGVSLRNNGNYALMAPKRKGGAPLTYYYYIYHAKQDMINVFFTPEIVSDVYFIYKNNPIVISRTLTSTDREPLYRQLKKQGNETLADWDAYFSFDEKPIFKQEIAFSHNGRFGEPGSTKTVIPYLIPVSNSMTQTYDCALLCLLDKDKLERVLIDPSSGYKSFTLFFEDKQAVYRYGPREPDESCEAGTVAIHSQPSPSGISLSAVLPRQNITRQIEEATVTVILFFVLSIFAGLAISVFLSYQNSLSVKRLAKTLRAFLSSSDVGERTQGIEKTAKALKNLYKEQISALEENIKITLFDKLINGSINLEKERDSLDRYLPYGKEPFVIAVLKFVNSRLDGLDHTGEAYHQAFTVIFSQILSDELPNIRYIHNIHYQKLILMVSIPDPDNFKPDIHSDLKEIILKISKLTGEEVMAAVSGVGREYPSITACYNQAFHLLRLKLGFEKRPVVFFEGGRQELPLVEFKNVKNLYELIMARNKEEALQWIDGVYRETASAPWISEAQLSSLYYNIQNTLIFAKNEMAAQTIAFCDLQYSGEKPLKDLIQILKDNVCALCTREESPVKSRNIHLTELFKEYIQSNFSNPNLSASLIAEQLKLSEKYLFRFIKEQLGKSVGEYVEEIRMNHAKALLSESKLTVSEIGTQCGFNSPNSFYKAFKRFTSVPPGVWRENQK